MGLLVSHLLLTVCSGVLHLRIMSHCTASWIITPSVHVLLLLRGLLMVLFHGLGIHGVLCGRGSGCPRIARVLGLGGGGRRGGMTAHVMLLRDHAPCVPARVTSCYHGGGSCRAIVSTMVPMVHALLLLLL
uniref:Uncharacterized protein n=1 Tax=Cacopsylla melanoneura TaxID=428564 RepID=A0A8D8PTU7_9HEMI